MPAVVMHMSALYITLMACMMAIELTGGQDMSAHQLVSARSEKRDAKLGGHELVELDQGDARLIGSARPVSSPANPSLLI